MAPAVRNCVEEYFHTLNPLAKRIVEEIRHTQEAYESLWDALSVKEQRQIVDEAIIHPEAVLKYAQDSRLKDAIDVFPCLRLQTGVKYVVYEDGSTGKGRVKWRDEHSAPFSWLTRSQQDLRNFAIEDVSSPPRVSKSSTPVRRAKQKPPAPPAPSQLAMDPPSVVLGGSSASFASNISPNKQSILDKLISKKAVFKLPFAGKSSNCISEDRDNPETESLLTSDGVAPKIVKPAIVLKPRSPPPPPPPKTTKAPPAPIQVIQLGSEEASEELEKSEEKEEGSPLLPPSPAVESPINNSSVVIPKTGFEFLDNW